MHIDHKQFIKGNERRSKGLRVLNVMWHHSGSTIAAGTATLITYSMYFRIAILWRRKPICSVMHYSSIIICNAIVVVGGCRLQSELIQPVRLNVDKPIALLSFSKAKSKTLITLMFCLLTVMKLSRSCLECVCQKPIACPSSCTAVPTFKTGFQYFSSRKDLGGN